MRAPVHATATEFGDGNDWRRHGRHVVIMQDERLSTPNIPAGTRPRTSDDCNPWITNMPVADSGLP